MDSLTTIMSTIASYGVAIVISVYLVWWITNKLNSKLDELVKSMKELNKTLLILSERIHILKELIEK